VARVVDHYEALGLESNASPQEIERAYQQRVRELQAGKDPDAPEELAEVKAAHAILSDPGQRAPYDALLREAKAEEDKKYAALDAELHPPHHHHRKTIKGSSGWLDALWAIFKLFT